MLVRPADYNTVCKLTFDCVALVVVTSTTLSLFPEATTHFAKLTFGASTWFVHFLHTRLFRKDYDTSCALTFNCAALVALFHRLGRWVVTMMYSLRKGHKRVWKLILYCSAFAAAGRIQCPHGPYQS